MNKCETGDYSAVTITFFSLTPIFMEDFPLVLFCLKLILKLKNPDDRHCTSVAVPFYSIALGFESKYASESGIVWVFVKPC